VIGDGVEILPKSRLCVQSLGLMCEEPAERGETEDTEGEECMVGGNPWNGSKRGSRDGARLGTLLESMLLLSSPKIN